MLKNKFIRQIPNIISFLGLLFGILSIVCILKGNLKCSLELLCCAITVDQFDGRIARYLKANSKLGGQIDSFCDIINFGILPFLILIKVNNFSNQSVAVGFIFIVGCILRLSKFNLQEEEGFFGIPTPCAACIAVFPYIIWVVFGIKTTGFDFISYILMSFFMNHKFKTMSLKKQKIGFNLFGAFIFASLTFLIISPLLITLVLCTGYVLVITVNSFR